MIMQQPSLPPPSDFTRPLESRFGSARPVSAMGFRPPRAIEYDDFEEPPFDRALARRPSASRKVSKHEEDRRAILGGNAAKLLGLEAGHVPATA